MANIELDLVVIAEQRTYDFRSFAKTGAIATLCVEVLRKSLSKNASQESRRRTNDNNSNLIKVILIWFKGAGHSYMNEAVCFEFKSFLDGKYADATKRSVYEAFLRVARRGMLTKRLKAFQLPPNYNSKKSIASRKSRGTLADALPVNASVKTRSPIDPSRDRNPRRNYRAHQRVCAGEG